MLKVAFAIVVSKYRYQLFCKFCNQMCTIFSTFITMLFLFYYSPANTPISGYSSICRLNCFSVRTRFCKAAISFLPFCIKDSSSTMRLVSSLRLVP